jgi:hypothetical protein
MSGRTNQQQDHKGKVKRGPTVAELKAEIVKLKAQNALLAENLGRCVSSKEIYHKFWNQEEERASRLEERVRELEEHRTPPKFSVLQWKGSAV